MKGKTPLQKHSDSTGIHIKQLAFSITYTRRETSQKHVQSRKALSFSQITIKITEHHKMSRNKVHDTKRSIQTFVKLLLFTTLEVNSKKKKKKEKKSKGINKSHKLFHAVIKFPNISSYLNKAPATCWIKTSWSWYVSVLLDVTETFVMCYLSDYI